MRSHLTGTTVLAAVVLGLTGLSSVLTVPSALPAGAVSKCAGPPGPSANYFHCDLSGQDFSGDNFQTPTSSRQI